MPHFPFQRLQTDLAVLIKSLPAGSRLPSEPVLAKQLGVSRATLREAMRMFETQGLIRRRQGAGTFVVGKPPVIEGGLEVLESMMTLARRNGLDVGPGPVTVEQTIADLDTAQSLEISEGAPLIRISRTMSADSRPVAYLVDTLPAETLQPGELTNKFDGSVLDYLLSRGDPLTISYTNITATNATSEVAKMLEIQRGDVLLQFTARLFTASGKVVDFSYSYFLPGYFKFHIVRRVGPA
ncbi:MAG: GntR family transcriptional regulator [Chloroflexi bacterium]|nr:GntR family transcriptional regulator [Chloroflexota bacterium]